MIDLKPLQPGRIGDALKKAERYRLLNEFQDAESICLDVLEVEPDNQPALVLLLLARTDQFSRGVPHAVERAREVLPRLTGEYERVYYHGIICERQAKYLLRRRGPRTGFVAYDWFRHAIELYQTAAELNPGGQDPILRHNTCVRLIDRNPHCVPAPGDIEEHGIE